MDPFAALADPVRRGLLRTLEAGSARVVDLADGLTISRPAVSRHLRVLTEAGLATAEDRGRERHYRLVPEGFEPVRDFVDGVSGTVSGTVRFADSALDGLELEVRRTVRERAGDQNTTEETG